jgi:hypothetical protein
LTARSLDVFGKNLHMEPIFFDVIRCALLITSIDVDGEDGDVTAVFIAVGGSDTTVEDIPRSTVVVMY